jgi:hypothetical protein
MYMYMYIYICIYVYMCIYIYTCIHIHLAPFFSESMSPRCDYHDVIAR